MSSVPDVTIRARVELGLKLVLVAQPDRAVHAVSGKQQIAIIAQRLDVVNLRVKIDLDAELLRAPLKNFE